MLVALFRQNKLFPGRWYLWNPSITTDDIFNFNYIDKRISLEKVSQIKALYRFYHKKFWCYLKAFKYFKRLNLNLIAAAVVATGTIASCITLNPAIIASISRAGLLLKTYKDINNLNKKIEMFKLVYTTYEKIRFKRQ